MTSLTRKFINFNRKASTAFDRLFPNELRLDGNHQFITQFAPTYLKAGMRIADVGSGKHPFAAVKTKTTLGLHVTGIDISKGELDRAPEGSYDEIVVADIAQYRGECSADLVICQALLEHVHDTGAALAGIASCAKPGGTIVLFVPSRNAVFARLNLLLPEKIKRWLLFTIYPQSKDGQGFKSYYDRCTPGGLRKLAKANNLEVISLVPYYTSSYFSFFLPLYVVWRLWTVLFRMIAGEVAAETFCMALVKAEKP